MDQSQAKTQLTTECLTPELSGASVRKAGTPSLGPRPSLGIKLLRLAWHLEYADFELLHPRYRSAGGLRRPLANRDYRFVGGSQCFLALPEGHTLQLSALPATEDYEPLEPFHLT